jgi:hypothetical protein
MTEFQQMVKRNMFYNRSSIGKKPMRATIGPAAASPIGRWARSGVQASKFRVNSWKSGGEEVKTMPCREKRASSLSPGYLSDCLAALPISQKYPKAQQTEDGEHDESRKEASGLLLHKPEHERRKESPQAASRSD